MTRKIVVDEQLRWRCAAYNTYSEQIRELERLADNIKGEIKAMADRYTEDLGDTTKRELRVAGESPELAEYEIDLSMSSRTSIKRENLIMAGVTVAQIDAATTRSVFEVMKVKPA